MKDFKEDVEEFKKKYGSLVPGVMQRNYERIMEEEGEYYPRNP